MNHFRLVLALASRCVSFHRELRAAAPRHFRLVDARRRRQHAVSRAAVGYRSGDDAQAAGAVVPRQAGDYNSPILQPWAKEVVRRQTDRVLAQSTALHTPQETCWPMGVPHILQLNFHTQIIDDGKQIVFLYERHNQRRIARLNATHPATVKPSWFGDSVAHWEGDTLVVDTVGLDTRTWVDIFATPHTDKLHVVERYRRRDAKNLDVTIEVDDPGTFTTKWSAVVTYRERRRALARNDLLREQYRCRHGQAL